MTTTSTLHSPGFWDHMPPAHELHIVMNDEAWEDDGPLAEQTLPARRMSRSHTNAWILGLAVTATGAAVAVAVANSHDPRSIGYKVEAALADLKGDKAKDGSEKPVETTPASTGAQASQEASTPAAEPATQVAQAEAPAAPAVKSAPEPSSQQPLPSITPAAGRSTAKPAPEVVPRHLASLSTSSAMQELRASDTPPVEMAAVTPIAPVTPITPVAPVVAPLTPASAPIIVPPPITPPASTPPTQQQPQVASTDSNTGE